MIHHHIQHCKCFIRKYSMNSLVYPVGGRRERARERERLSYRKAARSAPPSPASGHGPNHLYHPVGAASGIETSGRGLDQGGTQERVVLDPVRARWTMADRRGFDGMGLRDVSSSWASGARRRQGSLPAWAETRCPSGTGDVAPGVPVRRPARLEPDPWETRNSGKFRM